MKSSKKSKQQIAKWSVKGKLGHKGTQRKMAAQQQQPPPLLVVTSSRPPPPSSASASTSSTSSGAVIDPLTGAILPSIRTGAGVGLTSLHRYPTHNKFASTAVASTLSGMDVYYGHGTGGGVASGSGRKASAKDENIYLFAHRSHASSSSGGGGGTGGGDKSAMAATGQRWRTKPPEPLSSNVCVSPCGTFVLAGARSGRCYVWNALGSSGSSGSGGASSRASSSSSASSSSGGELIRIWTAHNRPVTCISFSSDGSLVLTAGQDGIVNAFALLDVVSSSSDGTGSSTDAVDSSIRPARTFSEHHLPISSLTALPSNRAVSVSSDRQAIVMELCSGSTLARIVLPASIRCVTSDEAGRRLYAGGDDGVVYCVDLDVVAVKETAESATIVSIGGVGGGASSGTSKSSAAAALSLSGSKLGETILGMKGGLSSAGDTSGSKDGRNGGVSELRGHSRAITALAVVDGVGGRGMLVSGSEEGSLRVWDLRTRACARVVQPWGGGAADASSSCPVSSILVVPRGNSYTSTASGPFGLGSASHSRGRGGGPDVLDLFRPLQRFPNDKPIGSVVPVLASNKNTALVRRWEGDENFGGPIIQAQKRPRTTPASNTDAMSPVVAENPDQDEDENDEDDDFLAMDSSAPSKNDNEDEEKAALRKELEEARATIARWEKVNNKLAKKLEKARGPGK